MLLFHPHVEIIEDKHLDLRQLGHNVVNLTPASASTGHHHLASLNWSPPPPLHDQQRERAAALRVGRAARARRVGPPASLFLGGQHFHRQGRQQLRAFQPLFRPTVNAVGGVGPGEGSDGATAFSSSLAAAWLAARRPEAAPPPLASGASFS